MAYLYKMLFFCFCLFGFFAQAYTPIQDDELKKLLEEFNYRPQVQVLKSPAVGCVAQDIEYTTTYPQRETPLQIQAKVFVPVGEKAPLVFILPPLGGANRIDVSMGEVLCKANIAALLITTHLIGLDGDKLMPVSDHDHTHRRMVSAIKGGVQVMGVMKEVNIQKLGLFGTSLGGILGSVVYGVMPEISAATLLVNGGDVPFILAHSDQGSIVRLKNMRMTEMGFKTDNEYEDYLRNNLKIDPLHFAKLIDPDTLKMYLSTADLSVPSEKQMEYYREVGSPKETVFYNLDHIKTIVAVLALGNHKPKIADWFNARFAMENPRLKAHNN